ncbi:hypothetical protein EDB84DRAFT_1449184 [Lactarius hengduanensis]|nr:hypothetical protein EDB84DRAFT_1449184 [Lactarius hengduanensis]
MDELVHHCLRELAFDGDLGCHPSRLRDFVAGYYTDSLQQVVDDAYFAFVWSLVVSQPTVRVGTVPDGTTTEVHIAPQQSQKRKAKSSVDDTPPVTSLALLPDARSTTLDELQLKYGDTLRVAVDAETSFAAITGSHNRPPKLTPMVYTALQFITRGREHGISTVDLGKKTGYDQKTCFYLIKQLLELELVVKLRRGGVGTNFCVHKYFFERSPLWRQIQGEGASLSKDVRADDGGLDNEGTTISPDGLQTPVQFDPMDARHLSSLSLIQSRIVKLLKNCKSYTHPSQNLLVTLGFSHPTKTDRRFFQSRLRELIESRVVERVMLPSTAKSGQGEIPCIRLVHDTSDATNGLNETPATVTREPSMHDVPDRQSSTVKLNITLHKQIVDLLESAGMKGMTLSEISGALGNFDRRTLELLLTKLEKVPPPTHLSDLGIAQLMETHGRERRWRYFTVASYRTIIANEKLDDQDGPYSSADFSNVGNFAPLVAEDFYGDTTELNRFMDYAFNRVAKPEDDTEEMARRSAKSVTPITLSGSTVRGKKRGREEAGLGIDADIGTGHTPRKRGRPRKHPLESRQDGPSMAKKIVAPPRESHHSPHDLEESREVLQREGASRELRDALNGGQVPSLEAPKKRRRPSDDNYVAPEGSSPPRRRDGPSMRPPSPPFTGGQVERPHSQNGVHTTLVGESVIPRTASLEPVSAGKKRKEKSAAPHPRSNVSLLRRENEFLRILEESGGITHPGSKEFLDAHLALLDTLASAGEPTSGLPGIKVDKRTIESTFESLERRGKVKVLKTAISTTTGAQRPIRIIYFPTVDQSQLDAFLTELGKGPHSAPYSANAPSAAGALPGNLKARRPTQPLRQPQPEQRGDNIGHWPKNSGRTDQLFESDDQTIHDVLLTERSTIAQLYGFIPGKMTRARELHLATFQSWPDFPTPASPTERIMNFSQYFQGLPVGTYCSLISTVVHDDELSQLLSTEEGRRMPVKDLPQSLQTLLQTGRSRSKERLLELFVILHQLNLIVPLQPTHSQDQPVDSESSNAVPSSFEPFTGNVSPISYRSAPDFWLFKHDAPLHLWALSIESPPFWKIVSVRTRSDALSYWGELQLACESKTFAQSATQGSPSQPITPDPAFARFINRDTSWNRIYDLSWHQRQYLKRCISRREGDSPLRDEESNLDLERISWTISAPLSVVKDSLEKERVTRQRELDKASLLTLENDQDEEHAGEIAQAKELLAQKVAGGKMRKEREWGAILKAVHPHALEGAAAIRVARVRKRYLQSGVSSDKSRWEDEVRDAIRDLESAAKRVLPFAQRAVLARPSLSLAPVPPAAPPTGLATPLSPAGPPPLVASQPGKTIEQLITEQGPAREDAGIKKRKSKKGKDASLEDGNGNDDDQTHRRSRFQWNKDYDELAQDASAILRVRSRETGTRMDWFALSQIFPAVPKNSVRQRVASLRELQSNEIYMRRLEDQWTRLWKQYRGTEHLPDPTPRNQTNFDLIKHLQFLRRYVDKNALRVGFQETATSFILPETASALQSLWDVNVQQNDNPTWEFLWDSRIDSNREKGLLQIAFTTESHEMPTSDSNGDREIQVAEAALKVVFGTPSEDYDPSRAANLLRSVGEEQLVSRARDNLLSRGVLSKLVKDPNKPKPGRTLKISEINQNALGGSIVQDLFQDATTLDTLCRDRDGWREWPLSASDGDLAMLAQMTSEGLVDFRVDTADAKAARIEIDWNSKKADDDHIETTIFARFESTSDAEDVTESRVQTPLSENDVNNAEHGKTTEGTVACCRRYSDGLVNCNSCLNLALGVWFAQSNAKEREVCRHVLNTLEAAGPTGLDMNTLVTKSMEQDDLECVVSVLESLMDNTIPLVVRVGHVQPRIVLSSHSALWTAVVNEEPRINVLPRRWLNSTGEKVRETWHAALRAVIGTVVFRPGITQAEIIWRLRSVYDGAEVIVALRQLCEDGFLRRREGTNSRVWEVGLVPVREKQEKDVYWFLGDRRWYHAGVAK